MKDIISEKTLIPISMIVVIIGGVMWLTNIWATTQDNSKEIGDIKQKYSDTQSKLDKIQADLSFIKGFLKERMD